MGPILAYIAVAATASAACFDMIPAPLEHLGHATTVSLEPLEVILLASLPGGNGR